ncbi:MAG: hypothetical protein WBM50_20665 [Acidimicrobiales bacterium]
MSDDLPPDLVATDEIALDEFAILRSNSARAGRGPDPVADPATLFNDATPLTLARSVLPNPPVSILEESGPPGVERWRATEGAERFRTFLATGRDRVEPLLRRQGLLALIGLCLLGLVVAVSLPRTGQRLGSDVEVANDDTGEPAGPAASEPADNVDEPVNPLGSDGLFDDPRTERAISRTDSTAVTRRPGSGSLSQPITATSRRPAERLPTFAELVETSVVVGPETTSCSGPGAERPGCQSTAAPVAGSAPAITPSGGSSTTVAASSLPASITSTGQVTSSTRPPTISSNTTSAAPSTSRSTTTGQTTTTRRTTTTRQTTTTTRQTTTTGQTTPSTTRPTTTTVASTTGSTAATTSTSTSTSIATTSTTNPDSSTTTIESGPTEPSSPTNSAVACSPDDLGPGGACPGTP